MRRIPRVYIAGKFRGADNAAINWNIQVAAAFQAPIAKLGAFPVCVHIMEGLAMHDVQQQDHGAFWLEATMDELRTCDAVVLVPGWTTSEGTRAELATARQLGLPCFVAPFSFGLHYGPPRPSHPHNWFQHFDSEDDNNTITFATWVQDYAANYAEQQGGKT